MTGNSLSYVQFMGPFNQTSSKMVIGDPNYALESATILKKVVPGTWMSYIEVGKKNGRCAKLIVINEETNFDDPEMTKLNSLVGIDYDDSEYNWKHHTSIGIDSAQAGVFDLKYYQDDDNIDTDDDDDNDDNIDTDDDDDNDDNIDTDDDDDNIDTDDEDDNDDDNIDTNDNNDESDSIKTWIGACEKLTLFNSKYIRGGTIPNGVVCASGWGDGLYEVYLDRNQNNQINAIKIIFIPDNELQYAHDPNS